MKNYLPEIYVSYAWEKQVDGSNWSPLVKNVYDTIIKNNFNVKIDIASIQYKDSIKDFMRELGKGNYIVVIITEKYLKSKNCMFEVLEMLRYNDTRDRIFPIISNDAKIYESLKIVEYIKFWDLKIKELADEAKSLSNVAYAAPIFEDIELMSEIRRIFANFGSMLSEMNVLTPEKHNESDFKELLEKINFKLDFDKKNFEIKNQNEQLLAKINELEKMSNSLKLENSRLILDIENYKSIITEQKKELNSFNDFQFINDKLEEYKNRILSFQEILGLSGQSTKKDVIESLGNPTEEDDKNDNYSFYSVTYEEFITIYFHKSNDKIMSIEITSGFNINRLKQYFAYKSIYDSNFKLLDKTTDEILNYLGKPTEIRSGKFSYEIEDIIVNFTCYDFNDNKCSSIEVTF